MPLVRDKALDVPFGRDETTIWEEAIVVGGCAWCAFYSGEVCLMSNFAL